MVILTLRIDSASLFTRRKPEFQCCNASMALCAVHASFSPGQQKFRIKAAWRGTITVAYATKKVVQTPVANHKLKPQQNTQENGAALPCLQTIVDGDQSWRWQFEKIFMKVKNN